MVRRRYQHIGCVLHKPRRLGELANSTASSPRDFTHGRRAHPQDRPRPCWTVSSLSSRSPSSSSELLCRHARDIKWKQFDINYFFPSTHTRSMRFPFMFSGRCVFYCRRTPSLSRLSRGKLLWKCATYLGRQHKNNKGKKESEKKEGIKVKGKVRAVYVYAHRVPSCLLNMKKGRECNFSGCALYTLCLRDLWLGILWTHYLAFFGFLG